MTLVHDADEWTAGVEELPSCTSRAKTPEAAVAGIQESMADWIGDALSKGEAIPEPKSSASHSGRLLLRMPRTLHAELTRVAEREGVSMNQFITDSLSSVVGWRKEAVGAEEPSIVQEPGVGGLTAQPLAGDSADQPPTSSDRRSRLFAAALTVNFLIIAFAAILAIFVLLAALR
jgi:predicted RNase H-like HicB family nuclease